MCHRYKNDWLITWLTVCWYTHMFSLRRLRFMIITLLKTFLLCSGSATASVCITLHAVAIVSSALLFFISTDEIKAEMCGRASLAVDNKNMQQSLNHYHNILKYYNISPLKLCCLLKNTLTHSSPQIWHPGHVPHHGHCRLLQVLVLWIQQGGYDRQAFKFLNSLTHHSGHLDRDPELTWRNDCRWVTWNKR